MTDQPSTTHPGYIEPPEDLKAAEIIRPQVLSITPDHTCTIECWNPYCSSALKLFDVCCTQNAVHRATYYHLWLDDNGFLTCPDCKPITDNL